MSEEIIRPPARVADAERGGIGRSVGGAVRRRIGGNLSLGLGIAIVGTMILLAALASVIAPDDPLKQDVANSLLAPGEAGHLLGTDQLGRDVFSRLLYGARIDLFVAFGAVIFPFTIGIVVGIVGGFHGGWVDSFLVGVINVVFAFPVLVLLIALLFVLGPGVLTIIVAITIVDWVAYAQLTRTSARRERNQEYILAARTGGIPVWRILLRHMLPNIIAQPVVLAFSDALLIILTITTLGFLGLGVPPPQPDWGTMISEAQPFLNTQWWLAVAPGVAIIFTGLGLSLIADSLAERLDAR
ncbi:MAG TPA: ABC transporter permease [Solirubrobacterales bacterium]|jgi:peptide/nickel transport system permease protein|nr:ABC transporter permease [Solirubrobacterales bacterium]